jgi:hypothetical protein
MLVVKPNPRQMRYMRDSDSSEDIDDKGRGGRIVMRMRWERVVFAAALGGVVALGLIVLALHY